MSDLRSQLASRFGREVAPVVEPDPDDLLAEGAWTRGPWADRLRALARTVADPPRFDDRSPLGAWRQSTDVLAKRLGREGRSHEARELAAARDDFLAAREKAAWARVKEAFGARGLSGKAYRRLKQEGADPVGVLGRMGRVDASMGAARLVEALSR